MKIKLILAKSPNQTTKIKPKQTHKPKPNTSSSSYVNLELLNTFSLCCNSFLQLIFLFSLFFFPLQFVILSSTLDIPNATNSSSQIALPFPLAPGTLSSLLPSPRLFLHTCSFPVTFSFDLWQEFHVLLAATKSGSLCKVGTSWCPWILYVENGRITLLVKGCH